jgi:uncharacterized protein (DUF2267 family)
MTFDDLLFHTADRTGLPREQARQILILVVGVLGEGLSHSRAEALADDLPHELAGPLREAPHGPPFDLAELFRRVATRENVRMGFGVEHVKLVCRLLGEHFSPASRYHFKDSFPEEIAALFEPPTEPRDHDGGPVHLHPERGTLAEGRPGSRHPVSEARPDRAQSQSVVRSENPHGDTKLSSSEGLTQEREKETLATGQPGSRRPIHSAK